eukprot:gene11476-13379_t
MSESQDKIRSYIEHDPNLAAVKAIEYAKSFKDKFLCAHLKDDEGLSIEKDESLPSFISRCIQAQSPSSISKYIKENFAVPSHIDGILKSSVEQTIDDFTYFKGMDLVETRKTFELLVGLNEDIINNLVDASTRLSTSLKFNSSTFKTPESLKSFVFLLQNPLIYDLDNTKILDNLCHGISRLDTPMLKILETWLSRFSKDNFIQTLTNFEQFISVRLLTSQESIPMEKDQSIIGACAFIELLYRINQKRKFVSYKEFYNDLINNSLNLFTDFSNWNRKDGFTYTTYPFILNTQIKSTYLQIEYTLQQKHYRTIANNQFLGLIPMDYLVFKVHRENIINDTLNLIQKYKQHPQEMKKELKIQFIGEDGIDQGGVQKEFFQIVVRKIFDLEFGMFKYNPGPNTWWFNPFSTDLLEFELIGIILGLALYNTIILDVHFPLVVYKKLLGGTVEFEDVESVDPMIYKSLVTMRETKDDVSQWMTYFSYSYDHFGETKMIELKPGGNDIIVDNNNREEYIERYTNYLLKSSISKQYESFYKGFRFVCDSPILGFLRPEELEDLICGVEDLDFTELEKGAIYDGGYTKDDATIIYFWEVIHALPNEMKKKFLSFTTGSDRVPYGGLSKIQFSITKQMDSDRLPSAHTCFNALILPCYPTKEKLEDRLLKALNNSEGFGLR